MQPGVGVSKPGNQAVLGRNCRSFESSRAVCTIFITNVFIINQCIFYCLSFESSLETCTSCSSTTARDIKAGQWYIVCLEYGLVLNR